MMHSDSTDSFGSAPPEPVRRPLRVIAGFEAVKGFTALAASIGLLGLLHRDLRHLAEALIGHVGLNPGSHYPAMLLRDADLLGQTNLQALLLAVVGYALVRFVEAYGLWYERTWGEWLGALSGALYVPLEMHHLVHRPTTAGAVVVAVNVSVVRFLGLAAVASKPPMTPANACLRG